MGHVCVPDGRTLVLSCVCSTSAVSLRPHVCSSIVNSDCVACDSRVKSCSSGMCAIGSMLIPLSVATCVGSTCCRAFQCSPGHRALCGCFMLSQVRCVGTVPPGRLPTNGTSSVWSIGTPCRRVFVCPAPIFGVRCSSLHKQTKNMTRR